MSAVVQAPWPVVGDDPRAVRMNLETLVDLCHRLHATAATYRDIAGLNTPTTSGDDKQQGANDE